MDLELVETGNGGDLVKKPKDLSVIEGFENMIYLALFGGNVEQDTPTRRIESAQAFDFWGNNLFLPQDQSRQFNSQTERALHSVPLTSSGRLQILNAVKADLKFMKPFANVASDVIIYATDKVAIGIKLEQPDNLQAKEFIYIWDATRKELTVIPDIGGGTIPIIAGTFDFTFDFTFD